MFVSHIGIYILSIQKYMLTYYIYIFIFIYLFVVCIYVFKYKSHTHTHIKNHTHTHTHIKNQGKEVRSHVCFRAVRKASLLV